MGSKNLSPGFAKEDDYESVCLVCHNKEHSLGFAYASFAPKISHEAIANLMHACGDEARRRKSAIRLVKVGTKEKQAVDGEPGVIGCTSGKVVDELRPGTVVGGTAWCLTERAWPQSFPASANARSTPDQKGLVCG